MKSYADASAKLFAEIRLEAHLDDESGVIDHFFIGESRCCRNVSGSSTCFRAFCIVLHNRQRRTTECSKSTSRDRASSNRFCRWTEQQAAV